MSCQLKRSCSYADMGGFRVLWVGASTLSDCAWEVLWCVLEEAVWDCPNHQMPGLKHGTPLDSEEARGTPLLLEEVRLWETHAPAFDLPGSGLLGPMVSFKDGYQWDYPSPRVLGLAVGVPGLLGRLPVLSLLSPWASLSPNPRRRIRDTQHSPAGKECPRE